MPVGRSFGYQHEPNTCCWCGELLKPYKFAKEDFAKRSGMILGAMGDNLFCRKQCGYDFGVAAAQDGYRVSR